jgi:hypothetical protein
MGRGTSAPTNVVRSCPLSADGALTLFIAPQRHRLCWPRLSHPHQAPAPRTSATFTQSPKSSIQCKTGDSCLCVREPVGERVIVAMDVLFQGLLYGGAPFFTYPFKPVLNHFLGAPYEAAYKHFRR